MSAALLVFALACASLAAACDDREAFRHPAPELARMLEQRRAKAYGTSPAFPDGHAMQHAPAGTVPTERAWLGNPLVETGRDALGYATRVPIPQTRASLERGRRAFELVCATCHGILADGNSVVAQKMELRKPPSLHDARIRELPPGKVFEVASSGYGLMPGFAGELDVDERWAAVAYLEALQVSRNVRVSSLPLALQRELAEAAR